MYKYKQMCVIAKVITTLNNKKKAFHEILVVYIWFLLYITTLQKKYLYK